MNNTIAFQDQIPGNHCFGCGPENSQGLQIKSYWENDNESICLFTPSSHHSAGPTQYLNGGITSTIIDCHCVCTAIAKGYQLSEREIGEGEPIWFVTGNLDVSYKKPVSIDLDVLLRAKVVTVKENKINLDCQLISGNKVCVESHVVAIKVTNTW